MSCQTSCPALSFQPHNIPFNYRDDGVVAFITMFRVSWEILDKSAFKAGSIDGSIENTPNFTVLKLLRVIYDILIFLYLLQSLRFQSYCPLYIRKKIRIPLRTVIIHCVCEVSASVVKPDSKCKC